MGRFRSIATCLLILGHFSFYSAVLGVESNDYIESLKADEEPQKESVTEYPNGVNVIPGEADIHYPIYSKIPKSSFNCHGRRTGFYADTELRCQVWHICDEGGIQQDFLCTNGTIYSQDKRVCDWWYNVNCDPVEVNRSYQQNEDLYKGPPPKKDNNNHENEGSNDLPPPPKKSHQQQQAERRQQENQFRNDQHNQQQQQENRQEQQARRISNEERSYSGRERNSDQAPNRPSTAQSQRSGTTSEIPEKKRVIILRLPGPLPPGATIPPHILMQYAESVLAAEKAGLKPPTGLSDLKNVHSSGQNNQVSFRPNTTQPPQRQQQAQPLPPQKSSRQGPVLPYTPRPFSAFLEQASKTNGFNGQTKSQSPSQGQYKSQTEQQNYRPTTQPPQTQRPTQQHQAQQNHRTQSNPQRQEKEQNYRSSQTPQRPVQEPQQNYRPPTPQRPVQEQQQSYREQSTPPTQRKEEENYRKSQTTQQEQRQEHENQQRKPVQSQDRQNYDQQRELVPTQEKPSYNNEQSGQSNQNSRPSTYNLDEARRIIENYEKQQSQNYNNGNNERQSEEYRPQPTRQAPRSNTLQQERQTPRPTSPQQQRQTPRPASQQENLIPEKKAPQKTSHKSSNVPQDSHKKFRHSTPRKVTNVKFAPKSQAAEEEDREFVEESRYPAYPFQFNNFHSVIPNLSTEQPKSNIEKESLHSKTFPHENKPQRQKQPQQPIQKEYIPETTNVPPIPDDTVVRRFVVVAKQSLKIKDPRKQSQQTSIVSAGSEEVPKAAYESVKTGSKQITSRTTDTPPSTSSRVPSSKINATTEAPAFTFSTTEREYTTLQPARRIIKKKKLRTSTTTENFPYNEPTEPSTLSKITKDIGLDIYGRSQDEDEEEELIRAAQLYLEASEDYGKKRRL